MRAWRARSRDCAGGPHLTGRFALYAALALVAAALATFLFVRQEAIHRAERNGRFHTQFIADSILRSQLSPQDLRAPVMAARRTHLDLLFRDEVLIQGGLRANVYGAGGRVVYSTDHALMGMTGPRSSVHLL